MSSPTVLVPIDFCRASLRALQVAGRHAAVTGDALLLIHARGRPPRGFGVLGAVFGGDPAGQTSAAARRQLERLARPWNAKALIRDGDAVAAILEVAEEVGVRRIVMGRHGVRGAERMLLGSVANGVLRGSSVPVVVLGSNAPVEPLPGGPVPRAPVLCAVDFDHGGPVIEAAAAYAREHHTTLELAHVVQRPDLDPGALAPQLLAGLEASIRRGAGAELARLARWYGAARWHLCCGHVGGEVLALTEARQPMALVIGTHGFRASRAALGREADWLLRRSPVPVLVSRHAAGPTIALSRLAS